MADIELVIKIPEKIYKHILSMQFEIPGSRSGKSLLEEILKAIRTGTPLPKGHGRLIDEDQIPGDSGWDFSDRLMSTPTIIEEDTAERSGEE